MNFGLDSNGIVYRDGYGVFFHDFTKPIAYVNKPLDIYILNTQKHLLKSLGLITL